MGVLWLLVMTRLIGTDQLGAFDKPLGQSELVLAARHQAEFYLAFPGFVSSCHQDIYPSEERKRDEQSS